MQQDNPQQASLVGYIAGFFDGEGSVVISTNQRVRVTITSVDPEPLKLIQEHFGGWVREWQPASKGGRARRAFTWALEGVAGTLVFLETITPLLITKRRRAELALEFVRGINPRSGGVRITAGELERRERLVAEIRRLNQRGVQLQRLSEEAPSLEGDATVRSARTIELADLGGNNPGASES